MKEKGFTLIELLAVIVILAIIALIATPIILNIISDAREESNERSVELYANAIKNAVARHQLNGGSAVVGNYTSEQIEGLITVDYEGEVDCTTIQLSEDGRVSLAGCKVNGSAKEYTYGTPEDVEIVKACAHTDVDNSGTINLSDTVKCGSENFYVMSNDGSNVTMLTEKNIKVDLTNPIQSDSAGTIVYAETKYWVDDSDSLLSKYGTTTPAYIYDENSSLFEYVEAYETYLKETLKVSSASATLISYEQVENLGCDETKFTCGPDLGNGGLETSAPSWVYSTNYWIGSISKYLDYVYRIDSRGEFYSWMYSDLNANFGIRPVVIISVSEL